MSEPPAHARADPASLGDHAAAVRRHRAPPSAPPLRPPRPSATCSRASESQQFQQVKARVHRRLIERLNLSNLDKTDREQVIETIRKVVHDLLTAEMVPLNFDEREVLIGQVLDEIFGLGPLEPLIQDPDDLRHPGQHLRAGLRRAERPAGEDRRPVPGRPAPAPGHRPDRLRRRPPDRRLLADGGRPAPGRLRVNAIIPPLAVDGPHLSIRKFKRDALAAEDLLRLGTLTEPMLEFLRAAVKARLNILISGGTGAGKTTLLNILSSLHPGHRADRHDRGLGRAPAPPAARRAAGDPAGQHRGPGRGARSASLLINSLRMRPDRIIVGEVRGAEALDMLQAMNTGHDGSLTTLHANTPRDALSRLETMISMASLELPEKAMRQQIASAINLVIQMSRLSDGTRKMMQIVGDRGHGRRRDHDAGHLPVRARGRRRERSGAGPLPGERHPAARARTGSRRTASISAPCSSPMAERRGPAGDPRTRHPGSGGHRLPGGGADHALAGALLGVVPGARPRPRVSRASSARSSGSVPGGTTTCCSGSSRPGWPARCCELAMRIPGMAAVEAGLREAGMSWSLGTFLLLCMGCAIAFGLVASIIIGFWFATLVAEALGAMLPWLYVRRRRSQRLYAFEEAPPGRARPAGPGRAGGASDRRRASRSSPMTPPSRSPGEFLRTFEEQRFGLPFEDTHAGPGHPGAAGRPPHAGDGDPDPARGGRQPGRGAGQPGGRDPAALHHPAAAPGAHGPGPDERIHPGRPADRGRLDHHDDQSGVRAAPVHQRARRA